MSMSGPSSAGAARTDRTRRRGASIVLAFVMGTIFDENGRACLMFASFGKMTGERDLLRLQAEKKGAKGMSDYRAEKNSRSIDDLPGRLRAWPRKENFATPYPHHMHARHRLRP